MGAIGVATIFGESLVAMVAPPAAEALAPGPVAASSAQPAGARSDSGPLRNGQVNPGSNSGAPEAGVAKNPAGKP